MWFERLEKYLKDYDYEGEVVSLARFMGLAYDDRDLYGVEIENMWEKEYKDVRGMWQIPIQLEELVSLLKKLPIQSFLEIGTYTGYTFLFLKSVLENKTPNLEAITIDPNDFTENGFLEKFKIEKKSITSSHQDIKGKHFDLVFIDGDHSYEKAEEDFLNVGQYANICFFHDINDYTIKTKYERNGVAGLWEELKKSYHYVEITSHPNGSETMGFGILFLKKEIWEEYAKL